MMLLEFIYVSCFFTLIVGTTNPQRLSPEILSHDPFHPSHAKSDVTKNVINEAARPHPINNNRVLQYQESQPCKNSEILVKILSILQKMVSQDSSKGEMVNNVLNSVKENLKSDLTNVKSDKILNNLDDLEKMIDEDDGTSKPVLRQYTYRSAPGKLKTKIVFKYELPSMSHPNCKEAFEKLIHSAHDAYLKLSNDPICDDNGHNANDEPNNVINNLEHHHFHLNTEDKLNPELPHNGGNGYSSNNEESTLHIHSVPQDMLWYIKNNKLNPQDVLHIQDYSPDHNHHIHKPDSIDQNPNSFDFLPDAAHYHGDEITHDINHNPWHYHPNKTQDHIGNNDFPSNGHAKVETNLYKNIYHYDVDGNLLPQFDLTNDFKPDTPTNNDKGLINNIFITKNINSPAYNIPSDNGNEIKNPTYDEISTILNKYHLGNKMPHTEYHDENKGINDKNYDIINENDDKLLFNKNNINNTVLNDSENNGPNETPNFNRYINEIKNLISQNKNPQQNDQNSNIQNGVYHQDMTLNAKYFLNKQPDDQIDTVPTPYQNINGIPNVNGLNPYLYNANLNQKYLPYKNVATVNTNGLFKINNNPNTNNPGAFYNIPKDMGNINEGNVNKQNVGPPDAHYHSDYLQYGNRPPFEENQLPNLQHLLSVTNLYKLNDLPHKADVIELTYMLKRSEPLVYQPFYIVKYRLPYIKFLYNVRDLILRKPFLRTNQEKLYQELIALSNVTETSDDLKGYPKEDIVKLTFNNGALVTAKILNANDTNINEQLKVIQNLNSNLQPEDFLKLNKDNTKKYYRSGTNISEPVSKVSNKTVNAMRSYNSGLPYLPGSNIWNPQQQNIPRPVLPNPNVKPRIIPQVITSQQAASNRLPLYQKRYGR